MHHSHLGVCPSKSSTTHQAQSHHLAQAMHQASEAHTALLWSVVLCSNWQEDCQSVPQWGVVFCCETLHHQQTRSRDVSFAACKTNDPTWSNGPTIMLIQWSNYHAAAVTEQFQNQSTLVPKADTVWCTGRRKLALAKANSACDTGNRSTIWPMEHTKCTTATLVYVHQSHRQHTKLKATT